MDGGLLLDPVPGGLKIRLPVFMERSAPKCATTASWQRRPARRCGTRDRARAHHLPFTRTRAAQRRTSEMITRLGTKVGETDEMRLRSGHRVGVSGPAARIPTSAAEARAMLMKDGASTSEHVSSVSPIFRSCPPRASSSLRPRVHASPPPRRSRLPPPPPPPRSPRADFALPRPRPLPQRSRGDAP